MFVKTSFILVILVLVFSKGFSQDFDLEEKKPLEQEGIEYRYVIKNEQVKSNKGEEYSRFEITFSVTNKSGCTKLYAEKKVVVGTSEVPNLVATFNCNNANGKRFTARSATVKLRDFYVNALVKENGRELSQSVKAGYIFRNGETLKDNIIVLVPKGERPVIQFTPNRLTELQ